MLSDVEVMFEQEGGYIYGAIGLRGLCHVTLHFPLGWVVLLNKVRRNLRQQAKFRTSQDHRSELYRVALEARRANRSSGQIA